MRIKAGAYQNQLWTNLVGRFLQRLLEAGVIFFSGRSVSDRRVDNVAKPFSLTGLILGACSWIETVAIAMNAEEQDFGTLVKDVLRAVAVMHIPINDQNLVQVMTRSGMMSSQ